MCGCVVSGCVGEEVSGEYLTVRTATVRGVGFWDMVLKDKI